MEIRVLQYFLAVTREESISKAAEFLHITQPTLSRQMKELEEELGKQLFIRGNRKITLTEDGIFLRQRAQEIVGLVEKTETEIMSSDNNLAGDIYIGGGETKEMRIIARVIDKMQQEYPGVKFHLYSGNAEDIKDKLEKGLIDYGVIIEPADMDKYDYIKFPATDVWGLLMRKDSVLAKCESIKAEDIKDIPLICSGQDMVNNVISGWIGGNRRKLNIIATYNLIYNASLMVEEGNNYALCLEGLVNTSSESNLCFRPLEPKLEVGLDFVWKKYKFLSRPAEIFLEKVKEEFLKY